jgi:hypothetical protein
MPSAALRRAAKLLEARKGAVITARAMGMVQSLLVLGLMGAGGLLVALVTSRGAAVLRDVPVSERAVAIPSWIDEVTTVRSDRAIVIEGAGLVPLVIENIDSANPVHNIGAQVLLRVLNRLPNLRHNDGALYFLLAVSLSLVLLLTLTTRLRRSALAEASCSVASQLRRLIHRQMYRLGLSSLPSEGRQTTSATAS